MSTAEPLQQNRLLPDLSDGSGYNCIFKYNWRVIGKCALGSTWLWEISSIVDGRRWGWYFIPHKTMDYRKENWYEDQTLVLSFEDESDMIQAMLQLDTKS